MTTKKQRNQVIRAGDLTPGDRFTIQGKSAKQVYECIRVDFAQALITKPCTEEQERNFPHLYQSTIANTRNVIFLRHDEFSRYKC